MKQYNKKELEKHFKCEIDYIGKDCVIFKTIGGLPNLQFLKEIENVFGVSMLTDIRIDGYSQEGCPTCGPETGLYISVNLEV